MYKYLIVKTVKGANPNLYRSKEILTGLSRHCAYPSTAQTQERCQDVLYLERYLQGCVSIQIESYLYRRVGRKRGALLIHLPRQLQVCVPIQIGNYLYKCVRPKRGVLLIHLQIYVQVCVPIQIEKYLYRRVRPKRGVLLYTSTEMFTGLCTYIDLKRSLHACVFVQTEQAREK